MKRSRTPPNPVSTTTILDKFQEQNYDIREYIWHAIILQEKVVELEAIKTGTLHETEDGGKHEIVEFKVGSRESIPSNTFQWTLKADMITIQGTHFPRCS